jgi:hypothetical protein
MGYLLMSAECVRCREIFSSNPLRVPSVVVNGVREPLCRRCVEWANVERKARGLSTWKIFPDAYEPVDEREVAWD